MHIDIYQNITKCSILRFPLFCVNILLNQNTVGSVVFKLKKNYIFKNIKK